jgi:oligosaccharide repeat unit polymerase
MFAINMVAVFQDFYGKICFFAFNVTFFVFLIGYLLVAFITGEGLKANFNTGDINHMFLCLIISLLGLYAGFDFLYKKNHSRNYTLIPSEPKEYILEIRMVSLLLFYFTIIFAYIVLFNRISFVMKYGYLSSYLYYQSNVPFFITKISDMNSMCFFVFLATLPSKKQTRFPVFMFFIYGSATILYGQRTQFAVTVLIIIVYYIMRHKNHKEEKWITFKLVIIILILAPLIVVFLSIYSVLRNNQVVTNFTFWGEFVEFFKTQGQSVYLIGYGKMLEQYFPATNINYTFGPIINFLKYNVITSLFIKYPVYNQNTVGMALYGNSFGQTITYMVMPGNYLRLFRRGNI